MTKMPYLATAKLYPGPSEEKADLDVPPSASPSNLERAEAFVKANIPIFPCRQEDEVDPHTGEIIHYAKSPLTPNGFKDATTNPALIKLWFGRLHPGALIGMPTGKVTGFAVVDIDRKNGKDGFKSLADRGIELTRTCVNQTPTGGGEHHLYRRPAVDKFPSRVDVLPGVDIRADGGYIIAWGNLMPEGLQDLKPFPEALIDANKRGKLSNGSTQGSATTSPRQAPLTTRKEDLARESERAREWLDYIDPSSREVWNDVGLSLCGTFADDGFELWDEWSKRCPDKYNKKRSQDQQWADFKRKNLAPGLGLLRTLAVGSGWQPGAKTNGSVHHEPDAGKAARKLDDAAAKQGAPEPAEGNEPNGWPELQPLAKKEPKQEYPAEAFPDPLRDAIIAASTVMNTPAEMAAMSALGALSLAAQGLADVCRSEALKLYGPIGIYTVCIAPSGSRKSGIDKLFTDEIKRFERERMKELEPEIAKSKSELAAWDAEREGISAAIKTAAKGTSKKSIEELKQSLIEHDVQKPKVKLAPALLQSDATTEARQRLMANGYPTTGIIESEAGVIFGSHSTKAENLTGTLATFNKIWGGEEFRIDRIGRETVFMRDVRLTMSIQLQRTVIEELAEKNGESAKGIGFFARFLFAEPDIPFGNRPFKEARITELEPVNKRIRQLLETDLPWNKDGPGIKPKALHLSQKAKRLGSRRTTRSRIKRGRTANMPILKTHHPRPPKISPGLPPCSIFSRMGQRAEFPLKM